VGDRHQETLRRLLEVGRAIVSELDPEAVLERVLEEAQAITGARYAALGVLDEERSALERFLTRGIDQQLHREIGDLPRGRGVLGVLIDDPRPLRLADVGHHPLSYGFPANHPPMRSFLGVPIMIRGEAWGNLYLTEKAGGGEFTLQDEEAVVVLAQWAGTAIDNARLYVRSERRRREAESAVRALEAARDITDAVAGIADLGRVLELIVKRGRALVEARSVLIFLREGDDLVVAASAGHADDAPGRRIPLHGSTSGQVLRHGRPQRIGDVSSHLWVPAERIGITEARAALLVPMIHHGSRLGVLAAFDKGRERGEFTAADEHLLRTFAASAANAVALNRSVEEGRLRAAISAADGERGRWARELHDETLQALGGLRVLLAGALRHGDPNAVERAIREAIEDIETSIENLRAIISDLRPSLLDDLGLSPAIEALVERRRAAGLQITAELSLPAREDTALAPELETTVYRLIQEALTNVVKHARARTVRIAAVTDGAEIVAEVEDDGRGFDTSRMREGFGLPGLRERVYLAGGSLEIGSGPAGTLVRAVLPVRTALRPESAADQVPL